MIFAAAAMTMLVVSTGVPELYATQQSDDHRLGQNEIFGLVNEQANFGEPIHQKVTESSSHYLKRVSILCGGSDFQLNLNMQAPSSQRSDWCRDMMIVAHVYHALKELIPFDAEEIVSKREILVKEFQYLKPVVRRLSLVINYIGQSWNDQLFTLKFHFLQHRDPYKRTLYEPDTIANVVPKSLMNLRVIKQLLVDISHVDSTGWGGSYLKGNIMDSSDVIQFSSIQINNFANLKHQFLQEKSQFLTAFNIQPLFLLTIDLHVRQGVEYWPIDIDEEHRSALQMATRVRVTMETDSQFDWVGRELKKLFPGNNIEWIIAVKDDYQQYPFTFLGYQIDLQTQYGFVDLKVNQKASEYNIYDCQYEGVCIEQLISPGSLRIQFFWDNLMRSKTWPMDSNSFLRKRLPKDIEDLQLILDMESSEINYNYLQVWLKINLQIPAYRYTVILKLRGLAQTELAEKIKEIIWNDAAVQQKSVIVFYSAMDDQYLYQVRQLYPLIPPQVSQIFYYGELTDQDDLTDKPDSEDQNLVSVQNDKQTSSAFQRLKPKFRNAFIRKLT
ncbi:hypothetical protein MP228_007044 [Amoeboaphelidium protococcarum]|nr:hypothetical protein MP228_007044 [Amoeboaphelidium protococcarum]